jgi:mono/diheme cytochrome c family protein
LRGDFYFQAELNGALKFEINDRIVLEASLTDGVSPLTKAVSLSKGANKVKATYISPKSGHAYLRMLWTERGTNTSPIPPTVLRHSPPDARLELGRELFLEHRCARCHEENEGAGVPERQMDAPSFEGIGNRRTAAWMARWILDPKAERPSARMPKLARTAQEAEAMAAFLGKLKEGKEAAVNAARQEGPAPPEGKMHYEALLCGMCHDAADPAKISLAHVADKFPAGKLAEYLLAPEAHFAWTRMPNFKLSRKEAETLAAELLAGRSADLAGGGTDRGIVDKGRALIQERGCLNCHGIGLGIENKFRAPKVGTDWSKGCVVASANAPQFSFTPAQREALQAFGRTDHGSLGRHVPGEFAERQMRLLNCRACHGQQEAFPPVDILGGKLRPQWSAAFIAGEITYKPRGETHPGGEPWLFARMPAFKQLGHILGHGMAALHGYPPQSAAVVNIDLELAKHGQKLVGKDGGFSCVSCHAVGAAKATDVFDSEGINLAWSAERLLPQYYRRWVRNPLSIDPQTRMPVYFDEEGRSPLSEILDGDGEKQLTAMWHYLLMGKDMPKPNLGEAP